METEAVNPVAEAQPEPEPQPVEEPKPMTQEEMDDAEYGDLHVWYHALMNDLSEKVFVDGNPGKIDYPALMEVFCKMHKASPLGSTMREVLDDHLDDMVDKQAGSAELKGVHLSLYGRCTVGACCWERRRRNDEMKKKHFRTIPMETWCKSVGLRSPKSAKRWAEDWQTVQDTSAVLRNAVVLAGIDLFLPRVAEALRVLNAELAGREPSRAELPSLVNPLYLLQGTCFSTGTINSCWQTAVHVDKNNFRAGLGALTMLTAGTFSGGELGFPQFGLAVRYGMRDVLFADGSQWHGNLPITGIAGEFVRLSLILYLREGMMKACPAEPRDEVAS